MPTLPDELDPYLQTFPSVASPIHELPCREHIVGLDFNNFIGLLHLTLAPSH